MLRNGTDELLDSMNYPLARSDLIEAIGDQTIPLANGSETVRDVLDRLEEETYTSAEEARAAVYCGLSRKAIGRYRYSDRDPTPHGSVETPDVLSF